MFNKIDNAFDKIANSKWLKFGIGTVIIIFILDQCFKKTPDAPKNKIENQLSNFDGSLIKFREYIKNNLNDPSSFEHVETRYKDNGDGTASVYMKYRGKNAFNATLTKIAKCTLNVSTGNFYDVVTE
ncbi:hypothetical protein ACR79T_12565 [Sphingobacterium spiritivorum]|uniref:hypothetical protein n=1 Tax=Sphingobacterium spiritivorum TaxID=258 RepID=UPI003DA4EF87